MKSIPLQHAVDPIKYLEDFDGDIDLLLQKIYDEERFPEDMLINQESENAFKK